MKTSVSASLIACALGLPQQVLAQIRVPPEFKVGTKWQIEISTSLDHTKPLTPTVPIWDIDLYHAARTPDIIPYLRRQNPNTFIICYFNAGLIQTSDCDYKTLWDTPAYRSLLGKFWPKFPQERWLNIKNTTAHELIKRRITLANNIGCDGVDPDNIDGYGLDSDDSIPDEEKTGWNLSRADSIAFMRSLSNHAHSLTTKRGFTMLLGQKNAPEIARELLSLTDFAVLEDCKGSRAGHPEWAFCEDFQPHVRAGKPVLSIEYPRTIENPLGSGVCKVNSGGTEEREYREACAMDRGNAGFSTVLKIKEGSGELNGCAQYCDEGYGKGVVVSATNSERDGAACPKEAT